jgi:hypothetical protein
MKTKTMNNFKVIERNIKKVLLNKKWLVNIGCDEQYALNYKVAINFETNEVFTMENNSYMASYYGGYDDNVKYFNIPDFKYIQDDFEIAKQRGWLNKKDSFYKYIYNKLEQSPEWKIEELITDFINEVKEDYKIALEEDFCF